MLLKRLYKLLLFIIFTHTAAVIFQVFKEQRANYSSFYATLRDRELSRVTSWLWFTCRRRLLLLLPHTHTRLTALFRDYPGEPVPET